MNWGKVFVSEHDQNTRPDLVREFFRTIEFVHKGSQQDLASMGDWYFGTSPWFERQCSGPAAVVNNLPEYQMILEPEVDIKAV